jgi:outer membrane lipoprotein SlyB
MIRTVFTRFAALALVVSLAACAVVPGPTPGAMEVRRGVIEQIMPTELQTTHQPGIGAVIGGVGGLAIGSLIGRGSGRDVAMVLGAIGGGLLGNEQQQRYDRPVPGQQIIVRTNSGVLVSVVQPFDPNLRTGQRIYLEGSGMSARVVPQY